MPAIETAEAKLADFVAPFAGNSIVARASRALRRRSIERRLRWLDVATANALGQARHLLAGRSFLGLERQLHAIETYEIERAIAQAKLQFLVPVEIATTSVRTPHA